MQKKSSHASETFIFSPDEIDEIDIKGEENCIPTFKTKTIHFGTKTPI